MSDLSLKEKLLPSLLDRLIDDEPQKTKESRTQRIQPLKLHRESVLRDLEWLMNTENLEAANNLDDYPNAANSVINFGMPSLAGSSLSSVDVTGLQKRMVTAVHSFEPRILPDSLRVQATYDNDGGGSNSLFFEIQGDLWAMPIPIKVFLRTELDLETGTISVNQIAEH